MKAMRTGSVLMEFLVVFPIYLILFAGLFMLGDMLLRPIWLSSAERAAAYDLGELKEYDTKDYGEDNFSHRGWHGISLWSMNVGGMINSRQDNPHHADRLHFTDPDFKGPWAFCAASGATDDYSLFELTRGQLASVPAILPDVPKAPRVEDPEFDAWVRRPGAKRTIHSRSSTRIFNYYTYKRARYATEDVAKTYRARTYMKTDERAVKWAGRIVDAASRYATWNNCVYQESLPSVAGAGDEGATETQSRNGELPELPGRDAYNRYSQFVRWSD